MDDDKPTARDIELFEMFKDSEDFAKMPKPRTWYKWFGIPVPVAPTPTEYIKEQPWVKAAMAPKDEYVVITKTSGEVLSFPEPEVIPCAVVQRPIALPENPMLPIKFAEPLLLSEIHAVQDVGPS